MEEKQQLAIQAARIEVRNPFVKRALVRTLQTGLCGSSGSSALGKGEFPTGRTGVCWGGKALEMLSLDFQRKDRSSYFQ